MCVCVLGFIFAPVVYVVGGRHRMVVCRVCTRATCVRFCFVPGWLLLPEELHQRRVHNLSGWFFFILSVHYLPSWCWVTMTVRKAFWDLKEARRRPTITWWTGKSPSCWKLSWAKKKTPKNTHTRWKRERGAAAADYFCDWFIYRPFPLNWLKRLFEMANNNDKEKGCAKKLENHGKCVYF